MTIDEMIIKLREMNYHYQLTIPMNINESSQYKEATEHAIRALETIRKRGIII